MLNIVVVRPIPRVSARTATMESPGLLMSDRRPYRTSRSSDCTRVSKSRGGSDPDVYERPEREVSVIAASDHGPTVSELRAEAVDLAARDPAPLARGQS